MERLKSSIPEDLRTLILSTRFLDLNTSTAALAAHFSSSFQFSQLLEQLTDPNLTTCAKDAEGAANWKGEGNAAFGSQNYDQALSCYTKALRYAPVDAKDEGNRVALAVLFVNRAATLHKRGLLEPAMRDCDRATDAHPSYTKAWYRRGLVKCDMGDFAGAVIDMEKALAGETTSGSRLQIKRELAQMEMKRISVHGLKTAQTNSPSSKFSTKGAGASKSNSMDQQIAETDGLQQRWSDEKGWGLQTKDDLPSGSLVFREDPSAAVVLKSARDTHCHFCFETLPANPVPCSGCSIPLYCSELCKSNATGRLGGIDSNFTASNPKLCPKPLDQDDPSATSTAQFPRSGSCNQKSQRSVKWTCKRWGEHVPECGGASWSAVLPTEAVLGARMLFHSLCADNGLPTRSLNVVSGAAGAGESKVDTLCHHYDCLNANDKMELHVLGIVVAHCVRQSAAPLSFGTVPLVGVASKVMTLIAQARVNAMAIFGMVSLETGEDLGNSRSRSGRNSASHNTPVCTVQQVRVAQGIFLVGSRLNHSCIPNIHASFASGCLSIRAIANIPKGSTLELCYGPQVGELSRLERKRVLSEKYFFDCDCPGCSKLTLPDLFVQAFRCTKPVCMGVVLDPESLESKVSEEGDSKRTTHFGAGKQEKAEGSIVLLEKERTRGRQHSEAAIIDVSHIDNEFSKARLICEKSIGRCLYCGTVLDMKSVNEVARGASAHLERVEADLAKVEPDGRPLRRELKGALNALSSLRATLHAYNSQLAKGEDVVAQLLCDLQQPLEALKHCQKTIEILEHLYDNEHIVIGNEYLKMASVALMASDRECARRCLATVDRIFTIHYGAAYGSRMPYVAHLQRFVE